MRARFARPQRALRAQNRLASLANKCRFAAIKEKVRALTRPRIYSASDTGFLGFGGRAKKARRKFDFCRSISDTFYMRIDELNIIAGLEDAFYEALQLITHGEQLSLRENTPPLSRRRYERMAASSVFRTLRTFYTSLNPDRKRMWRDYGRTISLSPYASYLQYNSPRLAQGIDPSRVPPLYPGNKVKNWDMFGNPPAYWTHGPAGVFYGNGHVSVPENNYLSDTLIMKQDLTLLPSTDYEVAFEYHPYDYTSGQIKFGLGSQLHTINTDEYDTQGYRLSFTFTTPSGSGFLTLPVIFYARSDLSTIYINNVSVIEV